MDRNDLLSTGLAASTATELTRVVRTLAPVLARAADELAAV
jgi:hypothetical protein